MAYLSYPQAETGFDFALDYQAVHAWLGRIAQPPRKGGARRRSTFQRRCATIFARPDICGTSAAEVDRAFIEAWWQSAAAFSDPLQREVICR